MKVLHKSDLCHALSLAELEPVPGNLGRIRCDANWRVDATWASQLHDYDFWYVWAGRGCMETSDGPIDLHPGRGLWMRPGRRYEAEQSPDDHLGVTFIHFRLRTPRRLLAPGEFTPPLEIFDARRPDYFDAATRHVVDLVRESKSSAAARLLLKALLLEATADASAVRRDGIERHHHEAITRSLARLQDDSAPIPTISQLAREAGYTADHYTRVFQRVMGRTPKDFIVGARIERAMVLLRESSQTITQISDTLGYEDVGFFSRQFKRKIGLSPKLFRQRNVE